MTEYDKELFCSRWDEESGTMVCPVSYWNFRDLYDSLYRGAIRIAEVMGLILGTIALLLVISVLILMDWVFCKTERSI